MKNGVVELTATVSHPERDTQESFGKAVQQLLFDHQYQIMTDPTILDGDLQVGSVVESRDPLPEQLRNTLLSLGMSPLAAETSGSASTLLSRFQKRSRSKLHRWRTVYQRAADLSDRLADLEDCLVEEVPRGEGVDVAQEACDALIRGARTYFRLLLRPGQEGLDHLERRLIEERGEHQGRLVFHPSMVRALSGFITSTFRVEAPQTVWSPEDDDDRPLWVGSGHGPPVRTDPEYRVIQFVVRGRRASLRQYVSSVLAQSGIPVA